MKGAVYLLHFDRPYKHARHYLGYTENLDYRLDRHVNGNGARLIEVITQAGIGFTVARVWKNKNRKFERRLKGSHRSRLCPICNPNALKRKRAKRVRFTKRELATMRRGYREARRGKPCPPDASGMYKRGYRRGIEEGPRRPKSQASARRASTRVSHARAHPS